jgi:hypothetical protein
MAGLNTLSTAKRASSVRWTNGYDDACAVFSGCEVDEKALAKALIIDAGLTNTFGTVGFLTLKEPMRPYSSPREVKPPTGEPDAGNPHVRFGGGRDRD